MTRWICPYCETETQVKPLIVGHEFSCPRCKVESTVRDADTATHAARFIGELSRVTVGSRFDRHSLGLAAAGACAAAVILGALSVIPGLVVIAIGPLVGILICIVAVACLILGPLLFGIASELFRCRRLLEELLKDNCV